MTSPNNEIDDDDDLDAAKQYVQTAFDLDGSEALEELTEILTDVCESLVNEAGRLDINEPNPDILHSLKAWRIS